MEQAPDVFDFIPLESYKNTVNSICIQRLKDRYSLGAKLGTGGLCAVYDARDDYSEYYGDKRPLAIKLPLEYICTKSDVGAFMYAEYVHLSHLSHPNIVKVIDFGIDHNLPYIVLEQLKGRLLNDIPFSELDRSMKWNMLKTLFLTVQYIHSCSIIHADINPTNIMCLDDGTIKLFDFGISINKSIKQPFELDYQNIKAYNPRYTAPEIIGGSIPDQRSDFFSLAVMLFELYTKKLPYEKYSTELYDKPVSLYSLRCIPLRIRYWFMQALSADPLKRPNCFPLFVKLKIISL